MEEENPTGYANEARKDDIWDLLGMLEPSISLSSFLKVQASCPVDCKYILRGMIVFYGRHYMAYFYSEKFDCWYLYDDANITRIGCWTDVKNRCCRGHSQPILIFYEK